MDKMLDLVIKIEPAAPVQTATGVVQGGGFSGETVLLVLAIVIIFAAVVSFIMKRK